MNPRGISNKVIYTQYTPPSCENNRLLREPVPSVTANDFLDTTKGFWWPRYYSRYCVLHWDLADTVAKDILLARIRARNALYTTLPDLPAEQIAYAERFFSTGVDVATLLDVPSYGPSFISLWADAREKGLSNEEAAEYIRNWGCYRSPARIRDAERKARKQPLIDRKVAKRLAEIIAWRQTGDPFIPWDATVAGHLWQVRINDFPDDYMYTLLIDSEASGDFHEWPQAWDRGEPKPEVDERRVALAARAVPNVNAATLLSRYQNGEHEAVWRDLMALGPEVRKEPYKQAAWAVAQETMRRAAHNVKLLLEKLKQLDYQFNGGEWVYVPCTKEERKLLAACDRKHLWIPISLRAFREEVGRVDLVGSHATLSPMDDKGEPLLTDALEVQDCELTLDGILEEWSETSPEEREPMAWEICADAQGKADILVDVQVEDCYTVQLPNAAADAVLEGEAHKIAFVEYLRLSFQWGGFPGWEKYENRPEKELAFLREGLLPL